jgi:hypothetical protein
MSLPDGGIGRSEHADSGSVSHALALSCGDRAPEQVSVEQLVIAGWTGRDAALVEKHVRELEELGVARPRTTPIFYRVSASLLTTADEIQVAGSRSSGEVEFVLFGLGDGLWVGVGSDHTDREAETRGVTLSKQLCPKPVGCELWRYADLEPRWDSLVLRSFVHEGVERRLYQEGGVNALRHPRELIELYTGRPELPRGFVMFGGTLAVRGGIEPSSVFEIELEDPARGCKLAHRYRVAELPVEG